MARGLHLAWSAHHRIWWTLGKRTAIARQAYKVSAPESCSPMKKDKHYRKKEMRTNTEGAALLKEQPVTFLSPTKSSSTHHWFETAAGKPMDTHDFGNAQCNGLGEVGGTRSPTGGMMENCSPAHALRVGNRTKDPSEPKKKRGNPGNFTGERLAFLVAAEAGYMAASTKGRGHIQPFVDAFMASFWKKFAWYEGRDVEGRPLPPSAMAQLELDKTVGMTALGFRSLKPQSPWAVRLSRHKPPRLRVADRLPTRQRERRDMSDPEGNDDPLWKKTGGVNPALKGAIQVDITEDAVQEAFDERWLRAGLEKKEALKLSDPEIRSELVEQQNAEHEEALKEYHERADVIANPDAGDEEDRHHARVNLAPVVQPFLDEAGDGPLYEILLETTPETGTGAAGPSTTAATTTAPAPTAAASDPAAAVLDCEDGAAGASTSDAEDYAGDEVREGTRQKKGRKGKGKAKEKETGRERSHTRSETPSPTVSRGSSVSRSPSPIVPDLPETPKLAAGRALPENVETYINAQATQKRRRLMERLSTWNDNTYARELTIIGNEALFSSLGLVGAINDIVVNGTAEKGPPKPTRSRPAVDDAAPRRSSHLAGPVESAGEARIGLPEIDADGDIILPNVDAGGGGNNGGGKQRRGRARRGREGRGSCGGEEGREEGEGQEQNRDEEGREEVRGEKVKGGEAEGNEGAGGGEDSGEHEYRRERRWRWDKTGWPAWMRDGYALLWACEGGREWDEAVVKWTELERAYGMVNSTTPLPKRGRPEAIDKWVKGGRSAKAPEIVLGQAQQDVVELVDRHGTLLAQA
ncbi:hypothetical protein B0H14DRAFT_2637453 [Mycena olivaceomarginata]|nr:hypothetical protein B0H14DRAFT_2637453 [Mycena olivaceomarginata]